MHPPIRDLMTAMPHTIGHDMTVSLAKKMMADHRCHHLPVLDGGRIVGIVTSTDVAKTERLLPQSDDLPVEDIMVEDPVEVTGSENALTVIKLMKQKAIGSVIIAPSAEQKMGIFTSTDALHYLTKLHEQAK